MRCGGLRRTQETVRGLEVDLITIVTIVAAGCTAGVAIASLYREPPSIVRKLFVFGMFLLCADHAVAAASLYALDPQDVLRWQRLRCVILALIPGSWLAFSTVYGRANYSELLRRWKLLLAAVVTVPLIVALGWCAHLIKTPPGTRMAPPIVLLGHAGMTLQVFSLLGLALVMMNLERTLRAATGTMRWRVKFMIIGLSVIFAARVYNSTQALLFRSLDPALEGVLSGATIAGSLLVGTALFRSHLAGVDIYLSGSFIFHSFTLLVLGLYFIVVGVLAQIVSRFGGTAAFPLKALLILAAFVLLALVVLSDRTRQWARRFVSRHFRRPQYDYRKIWTAFAEQTAPLADNPAFSRNAARMVSGIVEALSVTVWLADEGRNRLAFGGSTSLQASRARELVETVPWTHGNMAQLAALADVVNIERLKDPWAETLRGYNPVQFPGQGGDRVCVPLSAGSELFGIMVLGDRVNGLPYTVEEFDLLKTLGCHIGAGLFKIRILNRLAEARQMEAFQAMSTFFVHDLKNTASTLSLTLQNLPRHFGDPRFREDALKSISASVDRINGLIRRLTLLREKLDIRPVDADLNAIVSGTLEGLAGTVAARILTEFGEVPRLRLDTEQIQKVVTNLVLNAGEAIGREGEIRLQTRADGHWAVLTVSDNGCGMRTSFVEESLFRPFKSTKKDGMGIGLFQSKMIVEAHGGRIEVESEEGAGSTFRLLLPVKMGGPIEADAADR